MDSHKRPRRVSSTSSASSASSTPPSPLSKAIRSSSHSSCARFLFPRRRKASRLTETLFCSPLYTCTLPPSCNETPTTFSSLDSLEAHNRVYHAFVCRAAPPTADWAVGKGKGKERERYEGEGEHLEQVCGRVFPDERMLELHLTEVHDELAQLKSERGEKIFACFLPSCSHLSSAPKGRRLHLIDKHGFPSQYFFGVTIWGVADVLKKGGGMVRRDWQPREGQPGFKEEGKEQGDATNAPPSPELPQLQQLPRRSSPPPPPPPDIDELAIALAGTSISLVPRSVRRAAAKQNKMAVESSTP
ncbi:hypothetical protein JCM10213_008423 [Rhodosporidiobolus nylandii]